jgi:predicted ATPase/class 3 adenylate cyclase
MRCSKCGSDNREGRRFCRSCGSKLGIVCSKCGAANEAEENFCGDCGVELVRPEPQFNPSGPTKADFSSKHPSPALAAVEEERKTVTALFADIKDSTELMEDLDPEDARAIIDPALRIMVEAVRRYDGYVVQSTGDGIFALFGAPLAHEDHPQRAVLAALQIQQQLRDYARLLAHKEHRRLRLELLRKGRSLNFELEGRVGVNTGEVLVRTVETGGKAEYTPVGHTANLASRLQTLAPAGSIAVSEHTRNLIEGYFELRGLGLMQVRGISEPVNVYEVTGLGPLRTHFQLSERRGLTKFVGRAREISELQRALGLASNGHGQIVAAVAEAGSGKSRLVYEFKSLVRNRCAVLEAYSVSHGKASPYQPVLELLHSFFKFEVSDDRQQRRQKISEQLAVLDPVLGDTLPYVFALMTLQESPDPLAELDSQIKRRRTLEAIKRIFLRYSVERTLVLIFEDLHWVDGETQALLDLLADSIGNAPVLLLVNYRPEYHHSWGGKSYYIQLRLDPLGKESAQELLTAMLGEAVELGPIKRLIVEKTGGNPFFMEEMVQTLLDQRVLVRNGTVKITSSLSQLHIPETVQGILAARIDRLPTSQKDLLQILSVLGKDFSFPLVESVVSKAEDELKQTLYALQLSEFIYEQPDPTNIGFSFKHALTQEVAYNSVPIERRRWLHASCGKGIEKLFKDHLDDYSGQLAYHYSHSADTEKALRYLVRAGEIAARRSGNTEAAIHFRAAIELLSTFPDTIERAQQELDLNTKLGPLLMALKGHGSADAEKVYRRARQLCQQVGETPQLFPVIWGLWLIHSSRGEYRTALDLGEQLLSLARQLDDRGFLLQAEHALWNTLVYGGEFVSGLAHARQGIALYDQELHRSHALMFGGHDPGECCRRHAATALWVLGYPDQAIETAESGLRLARDLGHLHSLCWAMLSLMMVHQLRREIGQAEEDATAALELSSENAFAAATALSGFVRAWARSEKCPSSERVTEMQQALADGRATGLDTWRACYLTLLAEHLGQKQNADEALNFIEEALTLVGNEGRRWYEAEVYRIKGELLLMRDGKAAQLAEQCFRVALETARRQGARSFELRAAMSLARLLLRQSRRKEARDLLADIYNWFTEGFETADLKEAKAVLYELNH